MFITPDDFSTPNEKFFAHVGWVVRKAREKGILVVLNPCYTGVGSSRKDALAKYFAANGPARCRHYGRYIGSRFKSESNIIWQAVGDLTPTPGSEMEKNWLEILLGIKEHAPDHLWSAHYRRFSTALDQSAFASHMSIDNAYGGNRSYVHTLRAYNRTPPKPTFFNEGYYEDTRLGASPDVGKPPMLRAQAYGVILSGATGHFFGSEHVFPFSNPFIPNRPDWRTGMDRQGSREMVHVKRLFDALPWHELVPDQDHSVVTKGYGTFGKDDRTPGTDYVTAARTPDGKLVMAYAPSTGAEKRAITVNLAKLSGPARARWYNPTSGAFSDIAGSPFANTGERDFATPGDNGTGANDWVLVLEAAGAGKQAANAPSGTAARKTTGPLRVHATNPRYFTDGTQNADGTLRAVYLTGSHVWNTLQDQGTTQPPPAFDFGGYLDFLNRHGHNFVRLWRFEISLWSAWDNTKPPLRYTTHHPWKRTGPGMALDGLPKFDFGQWDEEHFERLRSRVRAAGQRGIYVSIMLFEGWSQRTQPSAWSGHPMNAANNINGINGDPNGDGRGLEVEMLKVDATTEIQKAYIRKVIDAVNDLDNVLYEISNESLFTPEILKWQVQMVNYINEYQATKPRQHPVGMTNLVAYGEKAKIQSNDALMASPANWISPGSTLYNVNDPLSSNPPITTGAKVIILDNDHTWNNPCIPQNGKHRADHAWVWKSFLRGYNPICMDPLDLSQPDGVLEYAKASASALILARPAMGHTRAYAERMNLAAMTPRDDLASTRYCLANPAREFLVYLPDGGEVTVDLSAAKGMLEVEWFNPRTGGTTNGGTIEGGAKRSFKVPFEGDAVLYLIASKGGDKR